MCSPGVTPANLSQIGMYSSIIGGVAQTAGSVTNAINTRRTANANAALSDQQAADALARGQDNEFNQRLKTAQLKGTQTARLAANGVALDSGSPLDVLTSTDVMGAVDANTIRDNAAKEAYGYKTQAANYRAQASTANPFAAGFTSLIGSASQVADRWYKYKKPLPADSAGATGVY